jgi:hypothetical protein
LQAQSGKSIKGHVIAARQLGCGTCIEAHSSLGVGFYEGRISGVGFLGNAEKTYAYVASLDVRRQASMC